MSSIIRSPSLAGEKRVLARRNKGGTETPAAAVKQPALHTAPQAIVPAVQAPVQGVSPEEVERRIAAAQQAVVDEYREQVEAARVLAVQQGMAEGLKRGEEEGQRLLATSAARLEGLAGSIERALETQLGGLEDVVVSIAFEALCKMLGAEAATPEGVRGIVRQAIARVRDQEQLTVRLHPADLAALREQEQSGQLTLNGTPVTWLADDTVEMGGCVIDTTGGQLDARLDTQLSRLRDALIAARQRSRPEARPS